MVRAAIYGDPQAEWKLGNGAGRLPDLRHGRVPPGRIERRVPQLRFPPFIFRQSVKRVAASCRRSIANGERRTRD